MSEKGLEAAYPQVWDRREDWEKITAFSEGRGFWISAKQSGRPQSGSASLPGKRVFRIWISCTPGGPV